MEHQQSLLSRYSFALPQKTVMMKMAPNPPSPPPSSSPSPPPPQLQLSSSFLTNELLRNQLREVFPSNIKSTDEECKFLSREDFKDHAAQAYAFIQFKFGNILSQCTVPTTRTAATTTTTTTTTNDDDDYDDVDKDQQNHHENQQQRERLYRLLTDSKIWKERTGEENVSWARVDDVLKKLPVPFRKPKLDRKKKYRKLKKMTIATTKTTRATATATTTTTTTNDIPTITTITKQREAHADTRMGFRFGNMFAVKRYFTFGERRTQPGEIHVIQTSEVPFLYNEVKEEYRGCFKKEWDIRPSFRNGRFDPSDQKYFKTFILNPYSFYIIPENTVYLIITAQKTLFTLDRYNEVVFREMIGKDWRWKDVVLNPPNKQKELLLVQIPIPTTNVITTTLSGSKRKRKNSNVSSLDNETAWVYNDEINPPKFFNYQNGGDGGHQEDIQFIPQYYYFEEPQQQQQDQQCGGDYNTPLEIIPSLDPEPPIPSSPSPQIHQNIEEIIPSLDPEPSNPSSPSPPIHQNIEEIIPSLDPEPPTPSSPSPQIHQNDDVVFQTPSLYMDWDEISFPTLSLQQGQDQKEEWNNMLKELEKSSGIETMDSTTPPTPLAVKDSSLDKIMYDNPQKEESLNELHKLLEEMNQYGLDFMSN